MAVSTKLIKRRLKSIGNTKKITKAMEMIAAVKMRKAVDAALRTRVYAKMAQDLLNHLAYLNEPDCPLLQTRPVKKILLIMISSNRGLCGSFNANIFKKTAKLIKDVKNISRHRTINDEEIPPADKVEIEVLGLGRKSALFAKKNNLKLVSVFDKLGEVPLFEQSLAISRLVLKEFLAKNYDKVLIAYTDFKSSLVQEPKLRQLLPVSSRELEKMLLDLGKNEFSHKIKEIEEQEKKEDEFGLETYLFEPSVEDIINEVLPKLVEIQLYQAMLESAASEHSARMLAMKNASEAAEEMILELNLNYNKARQAGITAEIAEISAGASAFK